MHYIAQMVSFLSVTQIFSNENNYFHFSSAVNRHQTKDELGLETKIKLALMWRHSWFVTVLKVKENLPVRKWQS